MALSPPFSEISAYDDFVPLDHIAIQSFNVIEPAQSKVNWAS